MTGRARGCLLLPWEPLRTGRKRMGGRHVQRRDTPRRTQLDLRRTWPGRLRRRSVRLRPGSCLLHRRSVSACALPPAGKPPEAPSPPQRSQSLRRLKSLSTSPQGRAPLPSVLPLARPPGKWKAQSRQPPPRLPRADPCRARPTQARRPRLQAPERASARQRPRPAQQVTVTAAAPEGKPVGWPLTKRPMLRRPYRLHHLYCPYCQCRLYRRSAAPYCPPQPRHRPPRPIGRTAPCAARGRERVQRGAAPCKAGPAKWGPRVVVQSPTDDASMRGGGSMLLKV